MPLITFKLDFVSNFLGLWAYYVLAIFKDLEMSSFRLYTYCLDGSVKDYIQQKKRIIERMIGNTISLANTHYTSVE